MSRELLECGFRLQATGLSVNVFGHVLSAVGLL